MKKYSALFGSDSKEESLWHGKPFSEHAFGGIHYVPPKNNTENTEIVTTDQGSGKNDSSEIDEYERNHWPRYHWPSISHGTIYAITYDLLNCWFENDDINKNDYVRTSIAWYPDRLEITWIAKNVKISIETAMIDENKAIFKVTMTNLGKKQLKGSMVLTGDSNKFNYNANNQVWGKGHGSWQWIDKKVVIDKEVEWGMGLDFFPYHAMLKPEDSDFRWQSMYYQLAFAFEGDSWEQSEYKTDEGFLTWALANDIELDIDETFSFSVSFAGRWHGKTNPAETSANELAIQAQGVLEKVTMADVVKSNQNLWSEFFDKVPELKTEWPEDLVRLYYKAWTSVFYNIIPPTDMLLYQSKFNMGVCCKMAPSTMAACPAAWESSLSALCLSIVKPELACEIIESIYQTTDDDGFISELIGGWRMTQLAVNEPFTAWACYKVSKDKDFLNRIFPNLLKNLFYRTWHPTWKHHGAMMLRNFTYAHISGLYTKKIAEVLECPESDLSRINGLIGDTRKAVHSFWNEEGGYYRTNLNAVEGVLSGGLMEDGCDSETLIPVFRAAKPEVMPKLVELIKNEFIHERGVIRRKPKTIKSTKSGTWNSGDAQSSFTLKESNLMFVYKGLKEADPELFNTVVGGTLKNIREAGDFFECYDIEGLGRHNGPGSIFGAFAVIWGMLMKEDQVDWLYE